ncbi:hypothetical protein [Xanthomonas campestris]|uniref:hypothetical protein n=1 Tax=Xanthomonas campestris TaxID=339 RepID=UPI001E38CBFD|nr:hypothetical protein [Xanthomonas campestris]
MAANKVDPTPSSQADSSAHKRVRWRKPSGKRRPGVIDATRAELVRCLEQRHGSAWMRIKDRVAVAGYTIDRASERVRALRSDGAESLLAMAVALLYLTDVRTGFVGKPRVGGGRWHRYTLCDIAQLAYGAQGVAEIRRASRAIASMVSLGWAYPTKQVRRLAADASFRSEAGVRRINLKRICDMMGTTWLLQRDRRHADQTHGTNTASFAEAQAKKQAATERRQEHQANKARLEAELRRGNPGAAAAGPSSASGGSSGLTRFRDILGSAFD